MAINLPETRIDNAVLMGVDERVILKGEIDQNDPGLFLDPFFDDLYNQISEKLEIDIRKLNYFNSAAISSFLSFLIKAKKKAVITILIDRNKMWQRVSMDVVRSIDEARIRLKE